MAVERRVKPSERAKQQIAAKRKTIIAALVTLVLVAIIVAIGMILVPHFLFGESLPWGSNDTPTADQNKVGVENPDAVKAMLEQTVSYDGTWLEDAALGYQVYLPGTKEFKYDGQISKTILNNEAGTGVFGIVIGEELPTLNNDATADPGAVMDATLAKVTEDISKGLYGAKFSASYDVSTTQLGDKTPAILVTGDLQTMLGLKAEGSDEVQQITYNYPLCGIGFVRNNVPIMFWGAIDADDAGEAARLNTYFDECARITSSITVDTDVTVSTGED